MIKVQLPTREHHHHELNLNYGDVVFFIGQNGSGKSSLLNNLFQKIGYVLKKTETKLKALCVIFTSSFR